MSTASLWQWSREHSICVRNFLRWTGHQSIQDIIWNLRRPVINKMFLISLASTHPDQIPRRLRLRSSAESLSVHRPRNSCGSVHNAVECEPGPSLHSAPNANSPCWFASPAHAAGINAEFRAFSPRALFLLPCFTFYQIDVATRQSLWFTWMLFVNPFLIHFTHPVCGFRCTYPPVEISSTGDLMNVLVIDFQSSCLNVEQMNTFQRAPSTSTFIVPVQRIVSLLLETECDRNIDGRMACAWCTSTPVYLNSMQINIG